MAKREKIPDDPDAFDRAVEAFRARVPLTDDEFDSILEDEKRYAFTVSGGVQLQVIEQVQDAIARAIEDGTDFEDFKDEVAEALERSWGGELPGRLETIFRTNVMSAYGEGRYKMLTSKAVKEARPFWRLDVIDDDRTSDICEELIGTVLSADDPFWDDHVPPLHMNCRTMITPLSPDEAEEEGVDSKAPESEPQEGFGDAPDEEED